MAIYEGISDATLAAMAEQGHPIDGDEASQAINAILFRDPDDRINGETFPEGINGALTETLS